MNRGKVAARRCYYCGATRAEAVFVGNYKPRGQRDRCVACIADPLWVAKARVLARREEIAALQARANGYQAPKPLHNRRFTESPELPLFASGASRRKSRACGQAGSSFPNSPEGDA